MNNEKIIYIVHAIDTEGPLREPLSATFERLWDVFGIQLKATHRHLEQLRNKEIPLPGKEDEVAAFLDPFKLNYHETWDSINKMLANIMSPKFRNAMPDSFGGGWVYNWHCVDHVGYEVNPRRKDLGYHKIYDRYMEFLGKYESAELDYLDWHFHPMSTYKEAHRCATSFENSPHLHQILCRKILERNFFPSLFRAGFHTERPDSHWFLEQWIPFDCSNQSMENLQGEDLQNDLRNGRLGDWRRAPNDWSIYNPDFYDYQVPGKCRRFIARFLNINTRKSNIVQEECDKAFQRADENFPTLMGLVSHDYRELSVEVDMAREMIVKSAKKYPEVKFKFCKGKEAFNSVVHDGKCESLDLDVDLYKDGDVYKLSVVTAQGKVFGPQPYLAIKTIGGRFIHNNFDFGLDGKSWSYVFDADSVLSSDLDTIGVAANNIYGYTFLKNIKVER